MVNYLDFKDARCKNCYKCLRECPVKAIAVINHQAKIIDERCILCGTCINVCPQNAKIVHSETDIVLDLLKSGSKVVASVAPSIISSFNIDDFSLIKIALGKLGFYDCEETAVGAKKVVKKYQELLQDKKYKNLITSSCPAINRLIQLYYPDALQYLARVDSPMIAHAKLLKLKYPDAKIVFIGPCIAKKREAQESGLIDATLTFEDLSDLFNGKNIKLDELVHLNDKICLSDNRAKYFPISGGVIKSFEKLPEGYQYVAVDGIKRCMSVLENIDSMENMFLEFNACEGACINGPCSLNNSNIIKANNSIEDYVSKSLNIKSPIDEVAEFDNANINIGAVYPKLESRNNPATEKEIKEILAKTGKLKPEDELNCGACGYSTCREKAWAVLNGYAEVDMCLPYMRERAESMSFEIIQNSPNGIIVVDYDLKIIALSNQAKKMLGVTDTDVKGCNLVDYCNPSDFIIAQSENKKAYHKKIRIEKTNIYADLTVTLLNEHKIMFGILIDITEEVNYEDKLNKVRMDTLATTDEVIKKQMRVAQEIASLLGETTAETKVALHKLKKALLDGENKGE